MLQKSIKSNLQLEQKIFNLSLSYYIQPFYIYVSDFFGLCVFQICWSRAIIITTNGCERQRLNNQTKSERDVDFNTKIKLKIIAIAM